MKLTEILNHKASTVGPIQQLTQRLNRLLSQQEDDPISDNEDYSDQGDIRDEVSALQQRIATLKAKIK